MAFKSSAGTTPYQAAPSIQPKYGFRYSGSTFAPSMSPANVPPVTYTIPAYEAPTVAPTPYADNTSMTMGSDGDGDNGSSMASTQMSIDQANSNLGNTNIEEEQAANTGMYGPTFNPMSFVPGFGMMASLNAPAVPTSGYGTPGTYSSLTGNQFDADSRGIDPITGYAMPEYGTMKAFTNQIMEDPLGNLTGDPKNAFDYDPNSKKSQTVQFAEAKGLSPSNAATKDLMDMGIAEQNAQPGSASHNASLGIGYTDTGAAPAGSQFSSTGTFSSGATSTGVGSTGGLGGATGAGYGAGSEGTGGENSGGNQSGGVGQSNSAANTGYADDAAASDSGGGGK